MIPMSTITIPREEYDILKRCKEIVEKVETAIHEEWNDFLPLSEKTAEELWDNEYDEVWNKV